MSACRKCRHGEQVINDYRYLTLSLKAHPVSFMRADFSRQGITRNNALETAAKGGTVTVAGLVLVRQQPGSAKGVVFMTIEDETGIANIIVWRKMVEKYRGVVMGARLVKVRGRLQRESGVIHVVADHLEDMTGMLGLLKGELHSFGAMSRADEIIHPVDEDARAKRALRQLRPGRKRPDSGEGGKVLAAADRQMSCPRVATSTDAAEVSRTAY